jgi:hypothetical protein
MNPLPTKTTTTTHNKTLPTTSLTITPIATAPTIRITKRRVQKEKKKRVR